MRLVHRPTRPRAWPISVRVHSPSPSVFCTSPPQPCSPYDPLPPFPFHLRSSPLGIALYPVLFLRTHSHSSPARAHALLPSRHSLVPCTGRGFNNLTDCSRGLIELQREVQRSLADEIVIPITSRINVDMRNVQRTATSTWVWTISHAIYALSSSIPSHMRRLMCSNKCAC